MSNQYDIRNIHSDAELQAVMDSIESDIAATNSNADEKQPLTGNTFTVATLPSAALNVGRFVYVSDGSAGSASGAVSDGTNWKVIAIGATASST